VAEEQEPFADVRVEPDGGFSLPELKWRELLFVGALRARDGAYARDPARPLPPFRDRDLFPVGALFEVAGRADGRVVLRRIERL
jgi:hypothetical protein